MNLPTALSAYADPVTAIATPLPSTWTFWCDRILSSSPIGPIQPTAFSYSCGLNDFGNGTIRLPVSGTPFDINDLLSFWSWRVWAFYGGVPVWCGCPTGIVDTGAATVDITLTELSGYLTQRQLDAAKTYTQIEQTVIAAEIAAPLSSVGMTVVTVPGAGMRRDRSYAYLEGESRAELLTNLCNVISGPEFRAEYAISASTGKPTATLRIAYPRVGSTSSDLGLVVPGNVVDDFQVAWDSDQFRTRTYAVGDLPANAAANAQQPVVMVDRPQTNIPRIDKVDTNDGVVLLATLRDRANTAATIYAAPTMQVAGSVFESQPAFGTYGLGDTVTVNLQTPLIPGGQVTSARLVGMDVDAATGKVTWTLTLTQPPAKPRAALSKRLSTLDGRTTQMFKRNPTETT